MSKFHSFFSSFNEDDNGLHPGAPRLIRITIPVTPPHYPPPCPDSPKIKHNNLMEKVMQQEIIDLGLIRDSAWKGIPSHLRPRAWRLLLDYEPIDTSLSSTMLQHKRKDYIQCMKKLYENKPLWTMQQKAICRQINLDLPRMSAPIMKKKQIPSILEHVLFTWSVRHPASGYVQGMNDVLLIFVQLFFEENPDNFFNIEADSFWCFTKLMDGLQDVYTHNQPGLHRMISMTDSLISRFNPVLFSVLKQNGITSLSYMVEWMNCLLSREFSIHQVYRIWDLYISFPSKIPVMQSCICAAMMKFKTKSLMCMDNIDFLMKMKEHPRWTDDDIETILAQAYIYEASTS